MLTKEKLIEMFPSAVRSQLDLHELTAELNNAMESLVDETGFATLNRKAAFLAQLAHESASFTAVRENLNYSAIGLRKIFPKYFPTDELAAQYARQPWKIANRVYANRMGNGDEASGDGWKFRGRGLIQLTGKNNYVACGDGVCRNLAEDPLWLETPEGAVKSALWYWKQNNLNTYADAGDIRGLTKRINGGYHGLDDRIAKYEKAKQVLSTV